MKNPRSSKRSLDPYLAREQAKYKNPLPSREFILEALVSAGMPMHDLDLAKTLGLRKSEFPAFSKRLRAMEREGQIFRNRKGTLLVASKLALISGTVEGHTDGFGFLIPDGEASEDLYLNPREMQKVLHKDRVIAREGAIDRRGRREASIVEVLERANSSLVGQFHADHHVLYVVPSDRRISQKIAIPPGDAGGARPGEVVVVELVSQPESGTQPVGKVVEVLGQATDPGMEIEIALRKHALPFSFSSKAITQAKRLPSEVRPSDAGGRIDLRDFQLVTIDGDTARDFDDAVWAERQGKSFRLIVAIADVSHYVRPGDALDVEARDRGTSIYFPRRVIPMLPEKLSNELCSLNPGVDRLCMACDMVIAENGAIKGYKFYPAIMRSQARLTYAKAWEVLQRPPNPGRFKALEYRLRALVEVFRVLLKARQARGAIDFETVETQIFFDSKGKIETIKPVARNDAHRLIEECMLAANVSASHFLDRAKHPVLYRIHEGPTPEKLTALRDFLKGFGLHLQGGEKPHAKDYAKLLASIKIRPDAQLLQTVLLRSLQQAQYSPENAGHFGLAYESYAHFTSPIRRYPDLIIHRSIKAVLRGEHYNPGNWKALGADCSMKERRADEATREVEAWLKCFFFKDRVGEEFEGTISGVAAFGIFVSLKGIYIEGMVHVSELGSDYFQFDPIRHELLGERTGTRYRLADTVRVEVARVDLDSSRIDFVLAGEERSDHGSKRRVRTAGKKRSSP